jgi:hypothetical protein
MGTAVALTETHLTVEPGDSVTTQLRVRNTGTVVDQFSFQPLGEAAAWIRVEPPSVRLFPDTDEVVTVTIAPSRDSTSRPGPARWAIKAVPQEHPDDAAVTEGVVDVGAFFDFSAELQPTTGHGRFAGRYDVAIDNRGNTPFPIRFAGTDAEQALEFDFRPRDIETAPGEAHFAKLKVRPDKRIWRGQPKSHAFQLLIEPQVVVPTPPLSPPPASPTPTPTPTPALALALALAPVGSTESVPTAVVESVVLVGNLIQEPIIPKWLWKAMLILVALLAMLWLLWKTLVKPTVESAARAVAVEKVEEVAAEVATVEDAVEEAQGEVAKLEEAVDAAGSGSAGGESGEDAGAEGSGGGALDNVFNDSTSPTNFRLAVVAGPGESASTLAATLAADTSLAVTDMVLQNPGGDSGTLAIQVAGEPIIETSLENFRTLDFHFVAPYIVDTSTPLSIVVLCDTAEAGQVEPCEAAVSFSGYQTVTATEATDG